MWENKFVIYFEHENSKYNTLVNLSIIFQHFYTLFLTSEIIMVAYSTLRFIAWMRATNTLGIVFIPVRKNHTKGKKQTKK